MSRQILSQETKNNLEKIIEAGIIKDFYLAGGTAVALHLMHRLSIDLDFFTKEDFDRTSLVQKIITIGKFSIEKEAENSLIGVFNNTRITFIKYSYPLLFNLRTMEGMSVADPRDIGCMKITAISARGMKKDFIDLFFICREVIQLKDLLILFKKKYRSVDYNLIHILKSLIYFEDSDYEPMPNMIIPISWQEVKDYFIKEVEQIFHSDL